MMFDGGKIYEPGRLGINIFYIFFRIVCIFKLIPSDYIEPEIKNLQDSVGKYSVSIQYTPPKGLNPSEVGFLYSLKPYSTNIDCLLYKWEYEGLIKIEDKGNGTIILYRKKEIENEVPSYESKYWNLIFGSEHKDKVIWKWNQAKLDEKTISLIHLELLNYCVKQGFLYKNSDFLIILAVIGAFGGGFIFGYLYGIIIILISFVYIFYCVGMRGFGSEIGRTEKGKELYAQIMGYKYWLEKCEEEQVKTILEEDSGFTSRNFPYMVALRMDWKFLNGKFNK